MISLNSLFFMVPPRLVRARMGLQEAPKGATADATNSGPEPKRRERVSHGSRAAIKHGDFMEYIEII